MEKTVVKHCKNNSAVFYSVADTSMLNNEDFIVEVDIGDGYTRLPVYAAKVAYRHPYNPNKRGYYTFFSSFASIDFIGSMKVCVTVKNRNIDSVKIRPVSENIDFNMKDNKIVFSVTRECKLSVEINGDIYRNLQLYFNELEESVPDKTDPNVIFLENGVYDAGNCRYVTKKNNMPIIEIESNQTLYISGSAVLRAQIVINGDNTVVCGRGIIDLLFTNSTDCMYDSDKMPNKNVYPKGILIDHCNNVKISGIIIRNPCHYVISGDQCNNVIIDNIKSYAAHDWSDGIDMMASKYIHIKNCFIRSCDDSIAIYNSRWNNRGNSSDWLVENCILWSDVAHPINIGTHGSQNPENREVVHDIRFENIDILEANCEWPTGWGAIAFTMGDENICRNFIFENIRIDDFSCSSLCFVKVIKDLGYNPLPGYLIENILFKNIFYNGENKNPSRINGYDSERIVKDVIFENIIINGKKITNAQEGNFLIGDYTKSIIIK